MPIALILMAPALLAQSDDALARLRALGLLTRYASTPATTSADMASALFASLGMAPGTPVAPLAMLGAAGDPRDGYVLCAQPMHLEAGAGQTVQLARTADLTAGEVDALIRMLDRHFAGDDLRFEAVRADAWFACRHTDTRVVMTPPEAAEGRALAASLPRGDDGARWRRWQDEIAMLLHDHPVNQAREAENKLTVNALWFFGGGRLRDVDHVPDVFVAAAPCLLGDIARGLARIRRRDGASIARTLSNALADAKRAAHDGTRAVDVIAVAPQGDADASIAEALAYLESRDVDVVHLIAGGRGHARTWSAQVPGWWRRSVARIMPRPFAVPAEE
jgi:hypothetical protein